MTFRCNYVTLRTTAFAENFRTTGIRTCYVSEQSFGGTTMEGIVKWFNNQKGYGFISQEDGSEVFVHFTGINGEGFRSIEEGEKVAYDVVDGSKGPQAVNVTRV